jgi:hypothetical protein
MSKFKFDYNPSENIRFMLTDLLKIIVLRRLVGLLICF